MHPTDTQLVSEARRRRFWQLLSRNVEIALQKRGHKFESIERLGPYLLIRTSYPLQVAFTVNRVFGVEWAAPGVIVRERSHWPDSLLSNAESTSELDDASWPYVGEQKIITERMHVELEGAGVFCSRQRISGVGGLPSGLEGRVVIMISSGLDSPVAAYKAVRRGCVPVFVHFDNSPYSDSSNRRIAVEQARAIAEFVHGVTVKMYIVPHGDDLTDVLRNAPRKMTCIFCRRNMYRLAEEVAIREGAHAIVTGEIIGEQASQTTRNLLVESSAVCRVPVLRPCAGDDKTDIERMSRLIGTYRFASEAASCCVLPPKHPVVHANLDEIASIEERLDLRWIRAEVSEAEILVLKEEE
ncbi:MAG: hypothetical protein ACP6IT_02875 [Candidatus Thorarchaeota archaeon]